MKNDSALFFTCSLIEFIARQQKLSVQKVAAAIGKKGLKRVYDYADVLHCENIASVADRIVRQYAIPVGQSDNTAGCLWDVPDYWTIGEVFSRLIEDAVEDEAGGESTAAGEEAADERIRVLMEVYASFMAGAIENYNSDLFYQSRQYIAQCYKAGEILDE